MLAKGADCNAHINGITPLYLAFARGSAEIVRILLQKGSQFSADLNFIHAALQGGSRDCLKYAVWGGLTKPAKNDKKLDNNLPCGFPPLLWASAKGRIDFIEEIIFLG